MASAQQDLLRRRLRSVASLKPDDLLRMEGLPWTFRDVPARHPLLRVGDHSTSSSIILEGLTCRFNDLSSGRRQIQSLHIPGDMPDLLNLHLSIMDHSMVSISPCLLAQIRREELRQACTASPALASALWRDTLIDAAISRATIVRLGQMSTVHRLAHFLCEMHCRFQAIAAVQDGTFHLPVTQDILGETLGMTAISVNRCMHELRARQLVEVDRAVFRILDWDALVDLGDFDPTYLHHKD